jgi:predicted N-acetyltransferase YhbS
MTSATLRPATADDLAAINAVVEAAFMTWQLPERVKRLSLPSYRYDAFDLQHLTLTLAERDGEVLGVAAWEPADPADCPGQQRGLLLHGLYVHPEHMRMGIGRELLQAARRSAREQGFNGVLVKAQSDAEGFFLHQGLQALPVDNPSRDYAKRFWLAI